MHVLLTGGSGFVGSHIAEQLSAAGIRVRALVRASSKVEFLRSLRGVEVVTAPLESPTSLRMVLEGITHVVHAAGILKAKTPAEFEQVNAAGTERLARAAQEAGSVKRLVFVSSLTVSGPCRGGRPVTDESAPNPLTHYGRSKLAAERVLLSMKERLSTVILRPGAVYGPRDREILVFFRSVQSGVLPLVARAENRISMVYATDCAAACVRALHADVPSGSIYHVDDGAAHTFSEMKREIERALGRRTWLSFHLPPSLVLGAAWGSELYASLSGRAVIFNRDKCKELFEEWVCDSARGRAHLDFQPQVDLARGVELTADWYRKAGWLPPRG
jgi:nucleoside-diphosphate-sugar epimerase